MAIPAPILASESIKQLKSRRITWVRCRSTNVRGLIYAESDKSVTKGGGSVDLRKYASTTWPQAKEYCGNNHQKGCVMHLNRNKEGRRSESNSSINRRIGIVEGTTTSGREGGPATLTETWSHLQLNKTSLG